nr:hypothetical protein [Providencia rettgeri]
MIFLYLWSVIGREHTCNSEQGWQQALLALESKKPSALAGLVGEVTKMATYL